MEQYDIYYCMHIYMDIIKIKRFSIVCNSIECPGNRFVQTVMFLWIVHYALREPDM